MKTSRVRGSLLALFFCFATAPGAGEAPWYVTYEKALRAQERGEWQASVGFLQEAIAAKPHGQLKARTYGLWYVDYLPHYHMGIAFARMDDQQEALRQLALAEQDGAILSAPDEYEHLRRLKAELEGKDYEPLVSRREDTTSAEAKPGAKQVIGERKKEETVVAPGSAETPVAAPVAETFPAATPTPAPTDEPGGVTWYASYDAALAYLESRDWIKAVEGLKAAVLSRSAPGQYARTYGMWFVTYTPYYYLGICYYNQALWQFAVKYFELSGRLGELAGLEAERANEEDLLAKARLQAGEQSAKPMPRGVREMLTAEIADAVRLYNLQRYDEAEDGFRTILQLDPYNSVARAYMDKIAGATADTAGAVDGRNDFLAGTFEYYKGNFDQAIVLFRSAQRVFDKDAALHTYLGAALCGKARKSGTEALGPLSEARDAFARALALDPRYRPDRRVFPKDVLEVFRSVQEKRRPK